MRSINTARAEGTRIGKSIPELTIADALLLRVVDAQIVPQIKLLKSREDRFAEELGQLFGLLLVVSLAGGYASFDVAMPGFLIPDSVDAWLLAIGLGTALFAVLAMLAGLGWRRADRAALARRMSEVNALREAAFNAACEALNRRRITAGVPLVRNLARGTKAPDRIPTGVTPRGAEELVAQWMRYLGERAAAVTQYQGDGGVDVIGESFVAQVKHFAGKVGVAPIREIAGAAMIDGRGALFFTSIGYSIGAIEFANKSGVALFVYSAERAELVAMNQRAEYLMERGLG